MASWRVAVFIPAVLFLLAWPAAAQLRFGQVTTTLNGDVSAGYTADYGNLTSSDHNWGLGGDANFAGSFYNPNFLSFNADLFLNQSRANSNYQSISSASGINLGSTIFGGSHFPGSVSFSKIYNNEGNYAVPGLANYVTNGNSDTFGINWNENLPSKPSLSAGYQQGGSQYSVYGTNDEGNNAFHNLNLHSGYKVAGFAMSGYYTKGGSHALLPEVVAGTSNVETQSDTDAYGFNASHMLPLHGSFSASANRSDWDSNYLGTSTTGTVDLFNATASVHPTDKFSFSGSADYSDNLSGQLAELVVGTGASVPALNSNQASDSIDLIADASYTVETNLQTTASVERRTQSFLGDTYGETSYGAGVSYSHRVFNGNFSGSLSLTANKADADGGDTLGITTNENYNTEIHGWKVSGTFGYAQNVQTLLVTYMNSYLNYSGSARRRWGMFNFTAGASASHTGLSSVAGTTSATESYNTSFSYRSWLTASGNYSTSSGQALATGAGLVPVPVPSPVLPSSLVSLYGGTSYSFALSSSPIQRLSFTASYGKSNSNTSSSSVSSTNESDEFNALAQYQVRKLNIVSGFSRLGQGFSDSGTQSQVISSFYIGVSRWFKFL